MMEGVEAVVYGKQGCGKCDEAKQKFDLMSIPYRFVDMMNPGDNWRETGVVEARAVYSFNNEDTLPLIGFQGEILSYPEAMKAAKSLLREHKEHQQRLLDAHPVKE